MIWHKLFWKARSMLEMPMKKIYKFGLFWNVRRRLEVWKIVFFVFSSRKQGNKYVQNVLLAPNYHKKTYPKLMLNWLKVIANSTSIYTPWASSSRKFFQKLPIYMRPMFTHVQTMNELILNWKWTKTQLRVKLDLNKSELKIN
jgi:hypothetical protein